APFIWTKSANDILEKVKRGRQTLDKLQSVLRGTLELFREVEATGKAVIVTDHGKPAVEVRKYRDPLTILKGSVAEYADPTEPFGEGDWEALE
ncbi:MAG: hypothetical protein AB2807_11430, partial [Candidatus Sedimenticola endophacoides]